MDATTEDLIRTGRKEMYLNKNYDAAAKLFDMAKEMNPSYSDMYYLEYLCKRNRELQAEKTIIEKSRVEGTAADKEKLKNESARGGREAIYVESSSHKQRDGINYRREGAENVISQNVEKGTGNTDKHTQFRELVTSAKEQIKRHSGQEYTASKYSDYQNDYKRIKGDWEGFGVEGTGNTDKHTQFRELVTSAKEQIKRHSGQEYTASKYSDYQNDYKRIKGDCEGFGVEGTGNTDKHTQFRELVTSAKEQIKRHSGQEYTASKYSDYQNDYKRIKGDCEGFGVNYPESKSSYLGKEAFEENKAKSKFEESFMDSPYTTKPSVVDGEENTEQKNCYEMFMNEGERKKECYILQDKYNEGKTDNIENSLPNQDEKDTELLCNSFKMRAYVLQMGIKVFGSKPNYRPEVDFRKVESDIEDLILRARNACHLLDKQEFEYYMSQAEELYSKVAVVLPQASISKNTQYKLKNYSHTEEKFEVPRTKSTENTEVHSELNIQSKSYKEFVKGDNIDIIKCLKLAETAMMAKDFKKADRLIKKANRIGPTKNARDLSKKLEAAQKEALELEAAKQAEREAKEAEEAAKEAEEAAKEAEEAAKEAEKAAKEAEKAAKEADRAAKEAEQADKEEKLQKKLLEEQKIAQTAKEKVADLKKDKREFQTLSEAREVAKTDHIDTLAATQSMTIARRAFDNDDFAKADRFLLKAKRLDPNINIESLESEIRIAVASRSSSSVEPALELEEDTPVFENTPAKKKYSKDLYNRANLLLKDGNVNEAKKLLLKAQKVYNSNQVKDMLNHIEILEKPEKGVQSSNQIPQPSFVNSYSENHFAFNPSKEDTPSYHLANSDEIEEFLRKGRMALTIGDLENAEKYARKCENLAPVRSRGLMQDIKVVKELRQNSHTTRSGRVYKHDTLSTPNNETEDERWISAAEIEYLEGNFDKADEHLNKCKSLPNTPRVRQLVENVQAACSKAQSDAEVHGRQIRSGINIGSNREAIQICFNKAKEAFEANDLDTAENMLQKAYRMCPDEHILQFITKVQNRKEIEKRKAEKINEFQVKPQCEHQQEAQKCKKLAEDCYEEGDFDKAERLFQKAYRMYPTDDIQNCLYKLRIEKENKMYDDVEAGKRNKHAPEKTRDQIKAEEYTTLALKANDLKLYYTAEKYLTKAKHYLPNDSGIVDLLANVKEIIENEISNKSHNQGKKETKEKQRQMNLEAEKYLAMAEQKIIQGDWDNARAFAIISDSFVATDESRRLLKRIIEYKYKSDTKQKSGKSKNLYKAEQYVDSAEIAFESGDYKRALEYVIEANKFYFTLKGQKMYDEVVAAIQNTQDSSSSSNQTWTQKGLFNWFKDKLL